MEETTQRYFQTAKIPPLHNVCGTDDLREVMKFVSFKDGYAAATNAHIIAIVGANMLFPDFADQLEGCFISASGYKYIHDHLKKRALDCELTDEGIVIKVDKDHTHVVHVFTEEQMKERIQNGSHKFPNWQELWNTSAERANDPDIYTHWIQINPKFMDTMHSVFGSPSGGLKIRPSGENKPILVSASNTDWGDMYGIITPIVKTQEEFEFIKVPSNKTFSEPQ